MPANHEVAVHNGLMRANYRNIKGSKQDILNALNHYRGLEPKLEKFTFNDGRSRELVCLKGTIPVPYRGNTYNIPVAFWILDTHPVHAPVCYIVPTPDMQIKVSSNVDHNGKIYLPYLHEWKEGSSDILGLIQICIIVFGDQPPVFARQPGQPQPPPVPSIPRYPPAGNYGTPYPPTSSTTPYPPAYPPPQSNYMPAGPQYGNMQQPQQPPYPPAFPNPDATGTIQQEHLNASLRSAVEDKVRRCLREEFSTKQVEMMSLSRVKDELTAGQDRLSRAVDTLDKELSDLQCVCQELTEEQERLEKTLHSLESAGEEVDPDEAIAPATPLHKQLVNSYAEEAAIEDAIYYLGEALRQGVIDCDNFLKHVRKLSRRQFILRATMNKCRQTAGLPS